MAIRSIEDLKFLLGLVSGALLSALAVALKKQFGRLIDALISHIPIDIAKSVGYNRWEKKYSQVMYEEHRYLRFVGVRHGTTLYRPTLQNVFVSLEMQAVSEYASTRPGSPAVGLGATLLVDSALAKFTRLAILGNPGAGKTTLLEHILCAYSNPSRRPTIAGKSKTLPIYVPLRRCTFTGRTLLQQLIDPASRLLPPDLLQTYPAGFFENRLSKGRCMLLFDGLDEVLDEDDHVSAARMVEATAAVFPTCPVLVTSRLAGWRNLLGSQFTRLTIRELSPSQINGLVQRWHLAVITEQVRAAAGMQLTSDQQDSAERNAIDQTNKMMAVLEANPRLMQIASTPLLLSLMCLVFHTRQDLPKKRVRLYQECTKILLEEWDRQDKQLLKRSGMPSLDQKVELLERTAVYLFENNASEMTQLEIGRLLEGSLKGADVPLGPFELLRLIEERSGILSEKAVGVYAFTHLTIQEYFAATGLSRAARGLSALLDSFRNTRAEEVVLLCAGVVERADPVVSALLKDHEETDEMHFLLTAGRAVAEAHDIALHLKTQTIAALERAFEVRRDSEAMTAIQAVLAELGIMKEIVRNFGEFEIIRELGRGAFGSVYQAREKVSRRTVAIKVYHAGRVDPNEATGQRFTVLRSLRHPNIAAIYDFGRQGEQLFVSMQFVEGVSLEVALKQLSAGEQPSTIPVFRSLQYYAWVRRVLNDVMSGVAYLHSKALIHGDIKPSNVVWNGKEALLVDFGLDTLSISEIDSRRTRSFVPGTLAYLAPERFEGTAISQQADVYSLGLLLEELCTLKRDDDLLGRLRERTSSALEGIAPELRRIVLTATAFQPRDRYASVAEMLREIERVKQWT